MIVVGLRPLLGALAGAAGGVRRLGVVRDLLLLQLGSGQGTKTDLTELP